MDATLGHPVHSGQRTDRTHRGLHPLSVGAFRREFRVSLQICLVGGNCGSLTRFEWRPAARLAQPVNSDAGNAVSVFFVLITSAFRTSLPSAVSCGVDRSLREHL